MVAFATELLGRFPTEPELEQAREITDRMHREGLGVKGEAEPTEPRDDGAAFADIGMSSVRRQEALLKQLRPPPGPLKPRQLTCDEIADRKQEAERKAAEENRMKEERKKQLSEILEAFTAADERRQRENAYRERITAQAAAAAQLPMSFRRECERLGISEAQMMEVWGQLQNKSPMMVPEFGMDEGDWIVESFAEEDGDEGEYGIYSDTQFREQYTLEPDQVSTQTKVS